MDTNQTTPTQPVQAQPTPPTVKSGSGKLLPIIIGVLVLIIIGLGGFIFMNSNTKKMSATPTQAPMNAMTAETSPSPSAMSNLLKYTSSDAKWEMMYPKDVTVEKRDGTHIGPAGFGEVAMFYKHGPTQTTGTEFHDGLSVIVGTMKKSALTTLEKFADEQTTPNPEVGSTRTPFVPTTLGGMSGISTTITGMATFKVIFLTIPGNNEAIYYISVFAEGGDKATYQTVTDQMLASFKLL